ncbi:MAG: STAS domain-containing protein [Chloroflexota bacterium]
MSIWRQELDNDTWLVGVSDRLDQNQTPELEAELDDLLQNGRHRIIVDLSEVNYINSGGLRCLVTAWRKARKQGGNVVLTGLHARVHDVFTMVGFDKVFDVYPDRNGALKAWQQE